MPVWEVVVYTPLNKKSRRLMLHGLHYFITAKNKTEAEDKLREVIGPFRGRTDLLHQKDVPAFEDVLDRYVGIGLYDAFRRQYPAIAAKYWEKQLPGSGPASTE